MNLPVGKHPADTPLLKCIHEAQSMNTMPGQGDHCPCRVAILAALASCTQLQGEMHVPAPHLCPGMRGDLAKCSCPILWSQETGGHTLLENSYIVTVTLSYIVQFAMELARVFLSATVSSQAVFPCSPRVGLTGAFPQLICHVSPKFPNVLSWKPLFVKSCGVAICLKLHVSKLEVKRQNKMCILFRFRLRN